MRVRLFPYKMGSRGARLLSEALNKAGVPCKRVRSDGKFRMRRTDLVINWGNGHQPPWYEGNGHLLNSFAAVFRASNKLHSFNAFKEAGVSIPEFTTQQEVADEWRKAGATVVARTVLAGHSGVGIVLCDRDNPIVGAPLYVQYIKKKFEYRVHVFNGNVVDVQQKRKRIDYDGEANNQIRNHHNGWIFARNDIDIPAPSVCEQAIAAVSALGLDFGAVDVIWNGHYQTAYVLEVNTAPGLEGTTLDKYTDAIINLLRRQRHEV